MFFQKGQNSKLLSLILMTMAISQTACELQVAIDSKLSDPGEVTPPVIDPPLPETSGDVITGQWMNTSLENQDQSFQLDFDLKPLAANSDIIVGLSNKTVSSFTDLAPIVRFSSAGIVDARNGSSYTAANNLAYQSGVTYHVELQVHLGTSLNIYSVKVKDASSANVEIANAYPFRSENSDVASLNNLATFASVGSAEISNVAITSIAQPEIIIHHLLSVKKIGDGQGLVAASGINCGSDCEEDVLENSSVTLSATAESASEFLGWSGACSGVQSTCQVAMSQAKTVTAEFGLRDIVQPPVVPPVTQTGSCGSATRRATTWKFDRDNYLCGTYANGDIWVVGPVVITQITPAATGGQSGTMINPSLGRNQGFDKDLTYQPYVSSLDKGVSLPLTVAVNSSVVSSITADASTSFNTIKAFEVLTVVQSQPASGAFRPAAIGGGSKASQWNESQVNYGKLKKLSRSGLSAPSLGNLAEYFSHPWIEFDLNWTGRYVHPYYMGATIGSNGAIDGDAYGRKIADRTGNAILMLNLDFTNQEKRELLIGMIQVGIDNFGVISNGGKWYADGGHNLGRLTPVMLAAAVLNDSSMKSAIVGSAYNFQEFQNTFFVSQSDVDFTNRVAVNGRPIVQYQSSDIGLPEWGIVHHYHREKDNAAISAPYRDTNGGAMTALTMAARCMGMRSVMNWEPLFQYAERHLQIEDDGFVGGNNYNPTPAFHRQFYYNFASVSP